MARLPLAPTPQPPQPPPTPPHPNHPNHPHLRRDWTRTSYARGRDEDYLVVTRGRLTDRICVVLAGRAAEEVALGEASSYSLTDIRVGGWVYVRVCVRVCVSACVYVCACV